MGNLMVVKIISCDDKNWWYNKLINCELNVLPYDDTNYCLYGNPTLLISKYDVKVIGK